MESNVSNIHGDKPLSRSRVYNPVPRNQQRDMYRPCPHCGVLNFRFKKICRKCKKLLQVKEVKEVEKDPAVFPGILGTTN